jgi:hypothetical protein
MSWIDPLGLTTFATQDKAAKSVLKKINPTSIQENREYGGMIYQNKNGTFSHTKPIKGGIDGVDPGGPQACPRGTKPVAYYHTHGGPDPRYDSEHFSGADINYANHYGIDGYVGTPGGRLGKVNNGVVTYEDNALLVK